MRVILLGAPGTGKGTQAKLIAENYNIPKISTGDILREQIQKKNIIGKEIHNLLKNGELVSDEIVSNLIGNRIQEKDCINGFLLDGFPRTREQAKYISNLKIKIDYVLELIVPYELILKRICGRRVHTPSGRIYNINFNPPKEEGKDDLTQEKLSIREDDKIEIIKKRLENYEENAYLLNQYYLKEKNLKKLNYFKIDGKKDILNIQKKINMILKKR
ncbi:adenylate kinase [Buchnera aphidicola]|uniref:Adenylate kinase n=1 Tax=Buchnera aphidicola subsp. Rhopalosiphum maidis TaxID=118109 RepID=A0A3G2I5A3_BUCRM|nr:adenylate kinase [Buchnera aphidicola]AYN24602.1 adenylate kinase [Buchnera aphidicola (Rhopalosiphum maidis)]